MLHAYDEQLLGDLVCSRDEAPSRAAAVGALRDRIVGLTVRETPWRTRARKDLVRLATITTAEPVLRPLRLVADPIAVLLAALDDGELPGDGDLACLAEVARFSFGCSVPLLLFSIDEAQRSPGPHAGLIRRGTDAYHRVVGHRAPTVRGRPLTGFEGGAFDPTTFHDLEDVALAAEFFRTVTTRPAPTPEELARFAARHDRDPASHEGAPSLVWRHARDLAEVARAADGLARFLGRCVRGSWVVWVEVEGAEPDA